MAGQRGAPERLSHLQATILAVVAEGELRGEGGAYGWWEITQGVRRTRVTASMAMSFPRSLKNLCAKGLIEPIPYSWRGEECGRLWGLSEKGRALIRTRGLLPPHLLAESHPSRIDVS
jgi:hypothetical protein